MIREHLEGIVACAQTRQTRPERALAGRQASGSRLREVLYDPHDCSIGGKLDCNRINPHAGEQLRER
jgi:hypothetical protein